MIKKLLITCVVLALSGCYDGKITPKEFDTLNNKCMKNGGARMLEFNNHDLGNSITNYKVSCVDGAIFEGSLKYED